MKVEEFGPLPHQHTFENPKACKITRFSLLKEGGIPYKTPIT
jgi:hypothetical protein